MQSNTTKVTLQSPVIVGQIDTFERTTQPKPRVTKTETNRVSYMGEREIANTIRAANVSGVSVWAALCSFTYNLKPLDQVATKLGEKDLAKNLSKQIRTGWSELCKKLGEQVPDASGRSISVIARAVAMHKMPGIVAEQPATVDDEPTFYGKTFIEQRDKPEASQESAADALVRLAKSYSTHAGSRIPPGTGKQEQIEQLMLACAMALGRVGGVDAGVSTPGGTSDHRQEKADSRKQQAKQQKEGDK